MHWVQWCILLAIAGHMFAATLRTPSSETDSEIGIAQRAHRVGLTLPERRSSPTMSVGGTVCCHLGGPRLTSFDQFAFSPLSHGSGPTASREISPDVGPFTPERNEWDHRQRIVNSQSIEAVAQARLKLQAFALILDVLPRCFTERRTRPKVLHAKGTLLALDPVDCELLAERSCLPRCARGCAETRQLTGRKVQTGHARCRGDGMKDDALVVRGGGFVAFDSATSVLTSDASEVLARRCDAAAGDVFIDECFSERCIRLLGAALLIPTCLLCFDPLKGVRVGEALRPGPSISDEAFLAAAAAIGLQDGANGEHDDAEFASVGDGRATPDPYEHIAPLPGYIHSAGGGAPPRFLPDSCEPECNEFLLHQHHERCVLYGSGVAQSLGIVSRPSGVLAAEDDIYDEAGVHDRVAGDLPGALRLAGLLARTEWNNPLAPQPSAAVPVIASRPSAAGADVEAADIGGVLIADGAELDVDVSVDAIILDPLFPAPQGSIAAARNIVGLACRAANVPVDRRHEVVRAHTWSRFNGPLLRAAAAGEDFHPVIDWLKRAAHGCDITVLSVRDDPMPGEEAVAEAWTALKEGLRALGLRTRNALREWHSREGFGELPASDYLHSHVQVRLLSDAHEAIHGAALHPPALEDVYVSVALHLAARDDLEGLAADAERGGVLHHAGQTRQRRARDHQPSRAPADAYILEFDGGARGNPGPSGAGAILFAPASIGGGAVWAGHAFVGAQATNSDAEYNAAILGVRASARFLHNAPLHIRGDSALVIRQGEGRWNAHSPSIQALLATLRAVVQALDASSVTWEVRPRSENSRANALVNRAIDRGLGGDVDPVEWDTGDAAALVATLPQPLRAPVAPQNPSAPLAEAPLEYGQHMNGFQAIDAIPFSSCLLSPFVHLDVVPDLHAEAWAIAVADVLRQWRDSSDEVHRERMLKWLVAPHDILLRLPPRGGRRGRAAVAHRFVAWAQGDFATLVRWWQSDRAAARRPRYASNFDGAERAVEQALELLRAGSISRAAQRLDNAGFGDMSDDRVVEQLSTKHPARKEPIPAPSPADQADAAPFLTVKLRATLRRLDGKAGTGVSGFRNTYLIALTQDFADPRAAQVVDLLDDFASEYVNARLPAWFYTDFSTVRLVAPVKAPAVEPDGVPDVRPLGLGECLRRAIHTTVVRDHHDTFEKHFWPQQVAVGVSGGLSLLVLGVRLMLEVRPDFIVVKLDLRNAYNEVKRAAVLRALQGSASLRSLAPLFYATHAQPAKIHLSTAGMPAADFASEEGVHQGDALASPAFCAAIHEAVCELDLALAAFGGAARFDMDDGYAVGPPQEVFQAVARFADAVSTLGLELRVDKSKCFSYGVDLFDHPDRPAAMPLGRAATADGRVGYGVLVGGVPVGDALFVQAVLDDKTLKAMSKSNSIVTKLRDAHLPSVWTMLQYAIQPLFHYWLQHCYPSDCVQQARQLDDFNIAIAGICIPGVNSGRSTVARRLRLPARLYGGGIRSLVELSPAAFCATVCRAMPRMTDSFSRLGERRTGFMPCLTGLLGAGSFDDDDSAVWFEPLLSSGSRIGNAFAETWQLLREEVGERPQGCILSRAAAVAGRGGHRIQAALTSVRERCRHQQLDVELRALPEADVERTAWLNVDRYGTVWIRAWPSNEMWCSDCEFLEIACRYFGLPSPACAPLVGVGIAGTRARLDAHGFNLCSANLPGDGWRAQHDSLKWRILEDLREMNMRSTPEVYGLFAPLLPQVAKEHFDQLPVRKRQGILPDMLVTCRQSADGPERATLAELKTLHFAQTTYPASQERCCAVTRRAGRIGAEYLRKARTLDRQWLGVAAAQQGPVELKLRSFGEVRGLVFGSWGEASGDVDWLLSEAVAVGLSRRKGFRPADDDEPDRLKSILTGILRRRWGMTALRSNARLLLERLAFVGRGAASATQRRESGRLLHRARSVMRTGTGPRVWRDRM